MACDRNIYCTVWPLSSWDTTRQYCESCENWPNLLNKRVLRSGFSSSQQQKFHKQICQSLSPSHLKLTSKSLNLHKLDFYSPNLLLEFYWRNFNVEIFNFLKWGIFLKSTNFLNFLNLVTLKIEFRDFSTFLSGLYLMF